MLRIQEELYLNCSVVSFFSSLLLRLLLLRLSSAKPLAPVIMDGKKPEEGEDDEDKQYVVEEAAPPPPDAPELDVVSSVIRRIFRQIFFLWHLQDSCMRFHEILSSKEQVVLYVVLSQSDL